MRSTTILAAAIAAAYPAYAADATTTSATATSSGSSIQSPSATPTLGVQVSQGCFSSWGNLIFNSTQQYNSRGGCATAICYDGGFLVAAMTAGNECYCGTEYPPKDTVVDDSKCDISCPGYPTEACQYFTAAIYCLPANRVQAVVSSFTRFSIPESSWVCLMPKRTRPRRQPLAHRVL